MNKARDITPTFRVSSTPRVLTSQSLTYNQAGLTYNSATTFYGGFSNQSDQLIIHAKALDIHP